jgi:hypothetical protein
MPRFARLARLVAARRYRDDKLRRCPLFAVLPRACRFRDRRDERDGAQCRGALVRNMR